MRLDTAEVTATSRFTRLLVLGSPPSSTRPQGNPMANITARRVGMTPVSDSSHSDALYAARLSTDNRSRLPLSFLMAAWSSPCRSRLTTAMELSADGGVRLSSNTCRRSSVTSPLIALRSA